MVRPRFWNSMKLRLWKKSLDVSVEKNILYRSPSIIDEDPLRTIYFPCEWWSVQRALASGEIVYSAGTSLLDIRCARGDRTKRRSIKPQSTVLDPNVPLSSNTLDRIRASLTTSSSAKPISSSLVLHPPRPVYRQAAVLVGLSNLLTSQCPSILLTVRAHTLRAHPGQISLPGGHQDPELDQSLLSTALRETEEEIGIRPHQIEYLGKLDPLLNHTGTTLVTPFVAFVHPSTNSLNHSPTSFALRPNIPSTDTPLLSFSCNSANIQSSEVASVIQIPFSTLLLPSRQIHSEFRMGPYLEWDLGPETAGFSEPVRRGSDEARSAEVMAERRKLRLWGLSGWVIYCLLKKLDVL
ncbi:hypothetical protein CROQUDRAFT_714114 [Cronartium quercuum f. sp. fusiforme G11]|uniref:Nudix hydrolase domain-containing protein n=1 Tax=Cronartium quercuum f. sp. fusiforme G11 TaxID=708437 RepID=A0A9P6NN90_9BASI|nr:hypothetical protein CROQUDRAFT_714114 [Cronartium quercuum f. sp. fusiforme G11]